MSRPPVFSFPPTPQDWSQIQDFIKRYFVDERLPIKDLRNVLRDRHEFRVTERMIMARLEQWGYLKRDHLLKYEWPPVDELLPVDRWPPFIEWLPPVSARRIDFGISPQESINTSHLLEVHGQPQIQELQRCYRLLPIQIGHSIHDAFPDTGSSRNVITESRAKELGLAIDRAVEKKHKFTNACGKTFNSVGETSVEVSLPGSSRSSRSEIFSVVQKCAASIVVGNTFLSKYRIFQEAQYRFKKVISTATTRLCRLMYMDVPQERLRCSINGSDALAVADSGSEKNFLSLNYLQRQKLRMTRLPKNRGYVELADGTLVKAIGYVDVMLGIDNINGVRRFYVLDGLVCDVLLGDETMEELDIFVKHATSFVPIDEEHDAYQFHMLEWVDQLIDNVETFLENPDAVLPTSLSSSVLGGMKPKESSWNRLRSKLRGGNSQQQRYRALTNGIATALEKVDILEADDRKRRQASVKAALDIEKERLQDEDSKAQQQHNTRRRKLLEHKENLAQWEVKVKKRL